MFKRFLRRVEDAARRRADARAASLAERLRETLPAGIGAEAVEAGVGLSGRGLLRRLMTDAGLRWLVLQCARDEGRKGQ